MNHHKNVTPTQQIFDEYHADHPEFYADFEHRTLDLLAKDTGRKWKTHIFLRTLGEGGAECCVPIMVGYINPTKTLRDVKGPLLRLFRILNPKEGRRLPGRIAGKPRAPDQGRQAESEAEARILFSREDIATLVATAYSFGRKVSLEILRDVTGLCPNSKHQSAMKKMMIEYDPFVVKFLHGALNAPVIEGVA